MDQQPLVSAIIPAYNAGAFLAQAIESVLAQTLTATEAVVVDDGARDDTGAVADKYAAAHPDRVRVIHQENQGLPLARNSAIKAARGRYFALLDADDIWLPQHAERCAEVLERDPSVGLVHANAMCILADGTIMESYDPPRWTRPGLDAFLEILLRRQHVCCVTAVFRRSIVDRIGMFDGRFNRLGCEDRDMWLRIAQVAKLHYLDETHAKYRVHGNNMSSNTEKMLKARRILVEKFATGILRRRAMAGIEAELGHDLAAGSQVLGSIKAFSRAIVYDPTRIDAWKGLFRRVLMGRRLATDPRHQAI